MEGKSFPQFKGLDVHFLVTELLREYKAHFQSSQQAHL